MPTATYRDGFPSDGHSVKETLRPTSRAHATTNTEDTMTTGGNWTRIEDGYARGDARIFDNGAGCGPAKDSGRWAVEINGHWIANVDTLAEAKARTESEAA